MSARILSPGLSESFGQQFIVDNRGDSDVIPFEIVAKALPDVHTLLVFDSRAWLLPLLQNVPYNPITDYVPVTLAVTTSLLVVVNPSALFSELPTEAASGLLGLRYSVDHVCIRIGQNACRAR